VILLVFVYLLLFCYEWIFSIRRKQYDRKTITIVMVLLGISFLYAAIQIVLPYSLSPNPLLENVFSPLSQLIWKE
jgi:hypothetical protein